MLSFPFHAGNPIVLIYVGIFSMRLKNPNPKLKIRAFAKATISNHNDLHVTAMSAWHLKQLLQR